MDNQIQEYRTNETNNSNPQISTISDSTSFEIINAIRRLERLNIRATKSKIADATGFSIPTVSRVTSALTINKDKNTVCPICEDDDGFIINGKYAYFMGIHLGVQKIRVTICDFTMQPLKEEELKESWLSALPYKCTYGEEHCIIKYIDDNESRLPTIYNVKQRLNQLIQTVLDNVNLNTNPLISLCVATPAVCDTNTMEVKHCAGLQCLVSSNLKGLLYEETIEQLESFSIFYGFEHNTEAVLMYERECLYEKELSSRERLNFNNIAVVYVGSDIGVAFIVNGQLYRGRLGASGELGYLRAPYLPDFEENEELLKKLQQECFENNETVIKFSDITNCVHPYLTLEQAIRYRVFNLRPDDYSGYLKRLHAVEVVKDDEDNKEKTQKKIKYMKKRMPNRYEILKQYISYITNVLVNLLSMDIIIYGGSICASIEDLVKDLSKKRGEDAITCLADATQIPEFSKDRDDIVSIGATYAALMRCDEKNHKDANHMKPITVSWKELGVR